MNKKPQVKKSTKKSKILPNREPKKKGLMDNAKTAFNLLKENKPLLAISVTMDSIFAFVSCIVLFVGARLTLKELFPMLQMIIDAKENGITTAFSAFAPLAELGKDPVFLSHYYNILKVFLLIIVVLYLLWGSLQGINWNIAHWLTVPKRFKFIDTLKIFFIISLFWMITIGLVFFLYFSIVKAMVFSSFPTSFYVLANMGLAILLLVISYFAMISFGIMYSKKILNIIPACFYLGVKKLRDISKIYAFVLIGVLLSLLVSVISLNYFGIIVFLLSLILVLFPALFYTRVFTLLSLGNILKK